MRFDLHWPWLVLPALAVYLLWMSRKSYAPLPTAAVWASLGLRFVILVCLIGAVTRPTMDRSVERPHLIAVIDVSRSITGENISAALEDIDGLARESFEQQRNLRFSLIAFGRTARMLLVERTSWEGWPEDVREMIRHQSALPELYARRTRMISDQADSEAMEAVDRRIAEVERFRDEVAGDHTDLERALRLARNCGRTSDQRAICIYTDGHLNQGLWRDSFAVARESDPAIRVIPLDRPVPPEVAFADLAVPSAARTNEAFTAHLRIFSSVETEATVATFKDGYQVEETPIRLVKGENTLKVPGLYFRDRGFHTIEAVIRPKRDTRLENNTIRTLVIVPGEAKVLYVDSEEDRMPYLKTALEIEGIHVDARPASGVPENLSELLGYDAFILSDVPADRLSLRQMQMIRTYVRDFGGGFIMLGGDESFGLGGYYNTPVEEILPVRMPIQKDMIRPSLALMLVIDKSGSMDGVKIQLAKRAAAATAEAINPRDLIGLIGFDGEARVLLELTSAADRAGIRSRIADLDAGGGTFLYPALEAAHQRLVESNARRKHVIVLSDGQTQGFGYEEYVGMMGADGITLSSVGIGEGADMRLMEGIASAGGGRAYFTNDFYSIPQIFTREALRASKSMLVERFVEPIVVGDDVCLAGIDTGELPILMGYVATTPKPDGDVIIASDAGDPLLAKWRFGLGHTVAFTSDTKPRWAEDWLDWEDFAKFWGQLVRSVTGDALAESVSAEPSHVRREAGVVLTADYRDKHGAFAEGLDVQLATVDQAGSVRRLEVDQTGPGRFEASLPEISYGDDQQFVWSVEGGNPVSHTTSYGFVYTFSPEYATLGIDAATIDEIGTQLGGEVMRLGTERPPFARAPTKEWTDIWPHLLIGALLLIPLDILIRRIPIGQENSNRRDPTNLPA